MKAKCVYCGYEVEATSGSLMLHHLKETHPNELAKLVMSKFTLLELDASTIEVTEKLFWASQGSRGSYNKIKSGLEDCEIKGQDKI